MGRGNPNTDFGRYLTPMPLISAPQAFTSGWVNLGNEINCTGYNRVGAFLKVLANNSNGMRFRVMALHTSGSADLFPLPIRVTTSTEVIVSPEYVELANNADQNIALSWDVSNLIPYVVIQIEAGTVGVTAGTVADAHYSIGY